MNRPTPQVHVDSEIGADVDLDRVDINTSDGERLTTARANDIVRSVRRRAGRPSLSAEDARSPQISFRVPNSLRNEASEIARREGKSLSQLAREALEDRIRAS
ncbi:MAG: CopG family transcriptional regulator [Actinobacteria bacterium]|nr:CopG family transcriptional regulator [Actinomycetota bacterium]